MCSITENYYALCSCALTGAILSSETIAKCTNILISPPKTPFQNKKKLFFKIVMKKT